MLKGENMASYNPDTDKAWGTLYTRLEDENLVTAPRRRMPRMKWGLRGIAVLLLFVGIYFIIRKPEVPLLVCKNDISAGTLVKSLEDGSVVYLTTQASLKYPEHFAADSRGVALQGEAFFDIAKDTVKPFYIETQRAIVEVLGTAFSIKSDSNGVFLLSVQRGKVRVVAKGNKGKLIANAGETVGFKEGRLTVLSEKDARRFEIYTEKLSFKDESLEKIVDVINRTTSQAVVIDDEALKKREMTVHFYENDADVMTRVIALALKLEREVKRDTIYIR